MHIFDLFFLIACRYIFDLNLFIMRVNVFFLNITRPNCALDRSTKLCLYVPRFQKQVLKHVKILSERSKETKEQKKNKKRTKGASLLRNPLTMHKMHSLASLVMKIVCHYGLIFINLSSLGETKY